MALDLTPARQVLDLWGRRGATVSGGSRRDAARIARTIPYQTLHRLFREQFACVISDAEIARAIDRPDSAVCGFAMASAFASRDSIAIMVSELERRSRATGARIAGEASAYLPEATAWKKVRIWFVIAGDAMFDAVTLGDGAAAGSGPVVLINLTEVLSYGGTTRERIEALEHVLSHEVFHAGMRQVEGSLPGWTPFRDTSNDELRFLARVILDEGIAHYVDWRERPGADSLFSWKPTVRENFAFAQLATAYQRLRPDPSTSRGERSEILQLSYRGPLWSKYGAISGMFAAHRIEVARGREALRQAVAEGPREFLRAYREVALQNPALNGIPKELTQFK